MNSRRLPLLIIAAVLILAASVIYYYASNRVSTGVSSEGPAGSSAQEGSITIADIDTRLLVLGGSTKNISDYAEGILFVNFWATWCRYCELEMPDLIKLSRLVEEDGSGKVIAIDVNEKERTVQEFIDKKGFDGIAVLLDQDGAAAMKFGIEAYPTTFLFKEGRLLDYKVGMLSWDDMQTMLEAARNR